MGRGTVEGLAARHPLGELLPSLFHDDEFVQRLTAGLDVVLAPVGTSLDGLSGYVDPDLAPPDFLQWLAGWVGVALDEGWPESRQRRFVADAVELFSWRGTRRGVVGLVAAYLSVEPEVVEDGGASWSAVPGGDPPGRDDGRVEVVVRVPDIDAVDLTRLEAIVASAAPAHLVTTVRVERAGPDAPVVGAPPPRQAKAKTRTSPSTEEPET